MVVNIYEAKTNMSKLMHLLETGEEKEIIVCNRGTPILRWVPIVAEQKKSRPFGVWKGKFPQTKEEDFFALDEEIASEFLGR